MKINHRSHGLAPVTIMTGMLLLTFASLAAPPARYTVTDLGTIPGGAYPAVAYKINNTGQITGMALNSNFFYRPFIYENGAAREINAGTNGGYAGPLNDLGQVLGTFDSAYDPLTKGRDHSFLYGGGSVTDLSILYGAYIRAFGINNLGHFVGVAESADGSLGSFIYSNGVFRLLDFGPSAQFLDINDAGQILGTALYPSPNSNELVEHATLFHNGQAHDLGMPRGTIGTFGLSLNAAGDATGYSILSSGTSHGFVYAKGRMLDITPLSGDVASRLWSINDSQIAVGISVSPEETGRAVMCEHGKLQNLNDLIPRNSGWTLISAEGINRRGEIVGSGWLNGEAHPFLLTPAKPGDRK